MFFIDFETRSRADLKKVGAWAYSLDPTTEVLCMAYGQPGGVIHLWRPGDDIPYFMNHHLWAHNALFEISIWRNVLGWEEPNRWHDTMNTAAALALPLRLDTLAKVLGVAEKDDEGHKLMMKLSKPYRGKFIDMTPETDWRLGEYCKQDVRTEIAVWKAMGQFIPEVDVQSLDREINLRGVTFDMDMVAGMEAMSEVIDGRELIRFQKLTGLNSPNQVAKLLDWLEDVEHPLPDLAAETVVNAVEEVDSPLVKEVLQLRLSLGKKASRKLARIRGCADDKGVVRGLLQYHGAATGRWAGRLIQPQNFPRAKLGLDPETLAEGVRHRDLDLLETVCGDPRQFLSDALRALIIAPPGHTLVGGDFSQIEARVAAWLGSEHWKLTAFREGRDVYCETATGILGRKVTKEEDPVGRQIGKTAELAFGFGGGLNAWRQWDQTTTDEDVLAYRDGWRYNHPGILDMWKQLNNAALAAVTTGSAQKVGRVWFEAPLQEDSHEYMRIKLPSGRRLYYFNPRVKDKRAPWDPEQTITAVHYYAQKMGRWMEVDTYGGKLFENIVQAIARDIMVEAMFRVDRRMPWLKPILTIHDEVLWQTEESVSLYQLEEVMVTNPGWAEGLPSAVELWEGNRYGK